MWNMNGRLTWLVYCQRVHQNIISRYFGQSIQVDNKQIRGKRAYLLQVNRGIEYIEQCPWNKWWRDNKTINQINPCIYFSEFVTEVERAVINWWCEERCVVHHQHRTKNSKMMIRFRVVLNFQGILYHATTVYF